MMAGVPLTAAAAATAAATGRAGSECPRAGPPVPVRHGHFRAAAANGALREARTSATAVRARAWTSICSSSATRRWAATAKARTFTAGASSSSRSSSVDMREFRQNGRACRASALLPPPRYRPWAAGAAMCVRHPRRQERPAHGGALPARTHGHHVISS